MKKPSLSIVIPTYNERENIRILLPLLAKLFAGYRYELIVVDDSSPDGTGKEVLAYRKKNPRVRLITRAKKEGIGAALREGYDAATHDIIMSLDADMSFDPQDMPRLLAAILAGNDLATANRHAGGSVYEHKSFKVLLKSIASKVGNRTVTIGLPVQDLSANFRAIRKDAWRALGAADKGNAILGEMIVVAHRKGYKVAGVKVDFKDRRIGTSKINHFREVPKFLVRILWHRLRRV